MLQRRLGSKQFLPISHDCNFTFPIKIINIQQEKNKMIKSVEKLEIMQCGVISNLSNFMATPNILKSK